MTLFHTRYDMTKNEKDPPLSAVSPQVTFFLLDAGLTSLSCVSFASILEKTTLSICCRLALAVFLLMGSCVLRCTCKSSV